MDGVPINIVFITGDTEIAWTENGGNTGIFPRFPQ